MKLYHTLSYYFSAIAKVASKYKPRKIPENIHKDAMLLSGIIL